MKSIIIVGTGNLAEIAIQYLQRDLDNEIVAFSVEKEYNIAKEFCGLPVINFEDLLKSYPPETTELLIAIGPNKLSGVRARLYIEAKELGYDLVTYISPRAHVWDHKNIGESCFIFDGCIVEPETIIGANTVMWSGSIVAHHSVIGKHCFLAPSATISGKVEVKNNCFIGINATIRDHIVIEENCIIGCGAIIKKNTFKNGVYSAKGTTIYHTDSMNTHV
ncbi:acetyltransferase [Aquimarina sp. RZ0]|uniref:acetyltransferase n=1 Tax=Aquimarina sp. RZ0 TaxID=2607730 RepID=UPI0011F1B4FC|nr:acetyltransferase [Aquimarina sp. RZ0]KAA1247136.1 acetyltransferase [Aquimarina sp. RZ0]